MRIFAVPCFTISIQQLLEYLECRFRKSYATVKIKEKKIIKTGNGCVLYCFAAVAWKAFIKWKYSSSFSWCLEARGMIEVFHTRSFDCRSGSSYYRWFRSIINLDSWRTKHRNRLDESKLWLFGGADLVWGFSGCFPRFRPQLMRLVAQRGTLSSRLRWMLIANRLSSIAAKSGLLCYFSSSSSALGWYRPFFERAA